MVKRRIIINGKFLRAESTGVHRVAMEIANALADLAAEGHPAIAPYDFEVWHTHDGTARAADIRLPKRMLGFLTGIPWEQLSLPLFQGSKTLLSLCNIGPVASANAVTMIHDAQVHLTPQSYSRGFRLWYRFVQPILGARNRRLLTVSAFSKAQLVSLGLARADRIGVVHNGVDHVLRVATDPVARDALGLRPHAYVVALSSVQVHKNIELLFTAFADPRLSAITLVLFGSADRSAFEARGLAVPPNVVFAGRVSDGALRGLYEQALCLAFPSTTEGFGLPPLEAMLLGCPALVAPCGALPEVCGDAAIYAAADDAQAWVAEIDRLMDPAARKLRIDKGKIHASRFTWRAAALRLLEQFEKLK